MIHKLDKKINMASEQRNISASLFDHKKVQKNNNRTMEGII